MFEGMSREVGRDGVGRSRQHSMMVCRFDCDSSKAVPASRRISIARFGDVHGCSFASKSHADGRSLDGRSHFEVAACLSVDVMCESEEDQEGQSSQMFEDSNRGGMSPRMMIAYLFKKC